MKKPKTEVSIEGVEDWEAITLTEQVALSFEGSERFTIDDIRGRFPVDRKRARTLMNAISIRRGSTKYTVKYYPRDGVKELSMCKVISVNWLGNPNPPKYKKPVKRMAPMDLLNRVMR